jgi:hypothetical protein
MTATSPSDPRSLKEALASEQAEEWKASMTREYDQLVEQHTFDLVSPPHDAKIIGCRWVYKVKKDESGCVTQYKSRLVAQGFAQTYGVNFHDTFAPVAVPASTRTILALATHNNWHLHQINVKGAFLNGTLSEVVYMRQPPGYEVPGHENWVCHLRKTLYGLKQASRGWYQALHQLLTSVLDFHCSSHDHSVFYHRTEEDFIVLTVHVDDCLIASCNLQALEQFKSEFRKHYEISDSGEVHWLLGIEITHDRTQRMLTMSQAQYLHDVLHRFNMSDCRPASSPMDPGA